VLYSKKNRRRMDIVHDILTISLVNVRKTRIMYQANLNYEQLENYLQMLIEGGFIHVDGCFYLTTAKGQDFLKTFSEYLSHYSKVKQEIEENKKGLETLEGVVLKPKKSPSQNAEKN
jgi:predicted transcriptional regulator